MKTLILSLATLTLVFTASAKADWRKSVLGDQIETKVVKTPVKKRVVKRTAKKTVKRTGKRRYSLRGLASYYWQPQRVAAGGWFNPNALTAAHKTLPFGTRVRVTNLRNKKSVVVRINDRGPYIKGRIIDLSKRAAAVVQMQKAGVVSVKVDVLGRK